MLVEALALRHRGRRLRDRDRARSGSRREGALRLEMARSHAGYGPRRRPRDGAAAAGRHGAALARLRARPAPAVRGRARLAAARARGELHVFTWLGCVSGPQHARAQLRPARRLADARTARSASPRWPEPSVHKLPAGQPGVPLPEIVRPSRMVVAPRAGDDRLGHARRSTRRSAACPCAEVEATPDGPSWWGTGKLVESVVFPVDVPELAEELLRRARPVACRWCRELIASSPCPLCGHRGRPVRRRAPRRASAGRPQVGVGSPGAARRRLRVGHRRARVEAARRRSAADVESTITAVERSRRPVRAVGLADQRVDLAAAGRASGCPSPTSAAPRAAARVDGLEPSRARSPRGRSRSTTPIAPAASRARARRARSAAAAGRSRGAPSTRRRAARRRRRRRPSRRRRALVVAAAAARDGQAGSERADQRPARISRSTSGQGRGLAGRWS